MASDDEGAKGQEFVVAHRFMWRDYGLSGVTLLVYARIYGFCRDGGEFYESRAATADFLGTTPRTVTRAVDELLAYSKCQAVFPSCGKHFSLSLGKMIYLPLGKHFYLADGKQFSLGR